MSPTQADIEDLLPLTQRVFLILWALSENEHHGYRLLSEVEELSRGRVTIKPGSLYEAIQTLEGRGLIAPPRFVAVPFLPARDPHVLGHHFPFERE